MSIDPITLEILSNGLKSIADETYIALMKSAYSTNIKERHDHSTAIIDPRGRLVVQAENSLAIHLGSMMGLMNTLPGVVLGPVGGLLAVAGPVHRPSMV